jgi:type I restriction enzyme, S subunit
VEVEYPNAVASTGFTVIRPGAGVSSQFIFFQVLSDKFLQPLNRLQSGTSYPAVRHRDVLSQAILLPPTPEQERIVAKLKAAFSAVQRAEIAARRAKERLKRYRAVVLAAAVTGDLTRTWRESQRTKRESAKTGEDLLRRILAARRGFWEETELRRLSINGKEPKGDKWKARYRAPARPRIDDPPGIPKDWSWASVEQLAAHEEKSITDGPFGSNLKTSHYSDSGPRVIRLQNIGDGVFIDEKAHISRKHYESLKDHAVYPGDLVIRALGTPAPRACRIPDWLGPAIVKADCIRFKVAYQFVSSDYVLWALNSPPVQVLTEKVIHGIGRPRLNLTEIKSIAVPLPPLEEQLEIVRKVENRLAAAAQLSQKLDRQLERAVATRQSLIEEAFAGRLVPQDHNEEPASVLLARIRVLRETEGRQPRSKRMPKPKSTKLSRRPLLEVLSEQSKPITPEELFREAGFEPSEVDMFYRELASLRPKLEEQRPKASESRSWPAQAKVFLQLKGRRA